MTKAAEKDAAAFTKTELVVVIGAVFLLAITVGPFILSKGRIGLQHRINRLNSSCLSNLKQIGIAYQIWANDNNGHFPAFESVAYGGWKDLLTNADQGRNCWTNYEVMGNELGRSSRLLACPADPRWDIAWGAQDKNVFLKGNSTISYFVGVSVDSKDPRSVLAGDRNLGSGQSGPSSDYGFSPNNGNGNDVAVETNSNMDPLSWSLKMHSSGNDLGIGNILLGDGSVEQVTSYGLRKNYQPLRVGQRIGPVGTFHLLLRSGLFSPEMAGVIVRAAAQRVRCRYNRGLVRGGNIKKQKYLLAGKGLAG